MAAVVPWIPEAGGLGVIAHGASVLEGWARVVWLAGPAFEGLPAADACAAATAVPARHWVDHADECDDLLARKFRALVIGFVGLAVGVRIFVCIAFGTCRGVRWRSPRGAE